MRQKESLRMGSSSYLRQQLQNEEETVRLLIYIYICMERREERERESSGPLGCRRCVPYRQLSDHTAHSFSVRLGLRLTSLLALKRCL